MQNNLVSNNILVNNLVYRYLFPTICALLGTRISIVFASLFASRLLGGIGLGVISLVAPVSLVYFSIGSLIGVGSSIISGIALGKDDKVLCAQVYTLSYLVSILVGILMAIVGLSNLDHIVRFLGANADYFEYTRAYVRFYIIGGTGVLLVYTPLNYLRISGRPNMAMVMLLLLSFLEIAGMGVFVALLGIGAGGIALASVVSTTIACIFGIICLGGKNSPIKFQKPISAISHIFSIFFAGSPSFLNNICRAIQSFCINLLLVRSVTGIFLPAYSLVNTINSFTLAINLGVSETVLPMMSISFGEKDFRSLRLILKKSMVLGNLICLVLAVLIILVHNKIGFFFGVHDGSILKTAAAGFIFVALSLNLGMINTIMGNYFNVIGRVAISNTIVVCRLVLFMVLPAYLFFGLIGINSVWISFFINEVLTLGIAYVQVTIVHRRNPGLSRYLLLDNTLIEKSKVIDFSVKNTAEDVVFASGKISDFCEENTIPSNKIIHISLAIEEMLMMINEFSLHADRLEYSDLRLMIMPESIVLRIRNSGKHFNPVEYYYNIKDTEAGVDLTLGIGMILKIARTVEYRKSFGINNLIITI
jgi:Na+-driven multidrug efflux pump/anti-sigma regulatory factor (Ser/Thr protein kinase)